MLDFITWVPHSERVWDDGVLQRHSSWSPSVADSPSSKKHLNIVKIYSSGLISLSNFVPRYRHLKQRKSQGTKEMTPKLKTFTEFQRTVPSTHIRWFTTACSSKLTFLSHAQTTPHTHAHTCVHTNIHTHACAHTYTHIHSHAHTSNT